MFSISSIKQRLVPPSSRSFHDFERNVNEEIALLRRQLSILQGQNTQLSSQLTELQDTNSRAHNYEQTRDMMLYWQLFRENDENLSDATKRFSADCPAQLDLLDCSKTQR